MSTVKGTLTDRFKIKKRLPTFHRLNIKVTVGPWNSIFHDYYSIHHTNTLIIFYLKWYICLLTWSARSAHPWTCSVLPAYYHPVSTLVKENRIHCYRTPRIKTLPNNLNLNCKFSLLQLNIRTVNGYLRKCNNVGSYNVQPKAQHHSDNRRSCFARLPRRVKRQITINTASRKDPQVL